MLGGATSHLQQSSAAASRTAPAGCSGRPIIVFSRSRQHTSSHAGTALALAYQHRWTSSTSHECSLGCANDACSTAFPSITALSQPLGGINCTVGRRQHRSAYNASSANSIRTYASERSSSRLNGASRQETDSSEDDVLERFDDTAGNTSGLDTQDDEFLTAAAFSGAIPVGRVVRDHAANSRRLGDSGVKTEEGSFNDLLGKLSDARAGKTAAGPRSTGRGAAATGGGGSRSDTDEDVSSPLQQNGLDTSSNNAPPNTWDQPSPGDSERGLAGNEYQQVNIEDMAAGRPVPGDDIIDMAAAEDEEGAPLLSDISVVGAKRLPPVDFDTYVKSLQEANKSRVTIEVVEEDTSEELEKAAAEAAAKQARANAAFMAPDRQAFMEFELEGITLLISEDGDGRLNLSDTYVYDHQADLYERPVVSGSIPQEHLRLQVVPWLERRLADTVRQKYASQKMRKVIFVGMGHEQPYMVDFNTVFIFDDTTRRLSREVVHMAGPIDEMLEPTLRIRPAGVTVEEAEDMPSAVLLSEGNVFEDDIIDVDAQLPTPEQLLTEQERKDEEREERMREMEEEDKEHLELELDIPASDMM